MRELGVSTFHAKVNVSNTASLSLFKNKLKFKEVGHVELSRGRVIEWSALFVINQNSLGAKKRVPYLWPIIFSVMR
jgi:L-amino acid N-acyltransferase YncA